MPENIANPIAKRAAAPAPSAVISGITPTVLMGWLARRLAE